jgi:light-regulated signal transduction histidine kinase (bacteriophytochrome)
MKMKERKNYDSDFCGNLPLHLINHVQPYGILVVLRKLDFTVIQVSENIEAVTGVTARDIIDSFLVRIFLASS